MIEIHGRSMGPVADPMRIAGARIAADVQRNAARPAGGHFGGRQGVGILPDGAMGKLDAGAAGDERFFCPVGSHSVRVRQSPWQAQGPARERHALTGTLSRPATRS
ncbi:hypothetical protein [Paraburkholderia silvatlantica]|uniref:hypothetical protein n=1 Tax=Paraburkholderia silvatlantica TaxID=321895 RepID=UPI00105EFC64|nr:hypothetical protein [Paraburkholderia silvatlantica]